MSYLDSILDKKKSESMQAFSDWNAACQKQREKEKGAVNDLLAGVAAQITDQNEKDLQKDIQAAQTKAAEAVKSTYISEGRAVDEVLDNAYKELIRGVGKKLDADAEKYQRKYSSIFGQ